LLNILPDPADSHDAQQQLAARENVLNLLVAFDVEKGQTIGRQHLIQKGILLGPPFPHLLQSFPDFLQTQPSFAQPFDYSELNQIAEGISALRAFAGRLPVRWRHDLALGPIVKTALGNTNDCSGCSRRVPRFRHFRTTSLYLFMTAVLLSVFSLNST
jgi:hypothetical protein